LFSANELDDLRNRWNTVQTGFVDQPRRAVEQADELVASAMQRLAEVFAEERSETREAVGSGGQCLDRGVAGRASTLSFVLSAVTFCPGTLNDALDKAIDTSP